MSPSNSTPKYIQGKTENIQPHKKRKKKKKKTCTRTFIAVLFIGAKYLSTYKWICEMLVHPCNEILFSHKE